jgi:hypothetical protein
MGRAWGKFLAAFPVTILQISQSVFCASRLGVFPYSSLSSDHCIDSKNSMPLLSAVRVTMAFFQAGV